MKTSSPTKPAPVKKAASITRKAPAAKPLNGVSSRTPAAAASHAPVAGSAHASSGENSLVPSLQDQIAARAYDIWQQQGCPEGTHEHNWTQAEQEITRNEPAAFIP
ncbi:DUF2934 domain-containing protein [Prosthecobacter sp.]|uniref:DUF2934 domain-containing protein n=1 Tax=Prosthecobacter sp. TaxID=1965333 RepID=UPI003783DFBD